MSKLLANIQCEPNNQQNPTLLLCYSSSRYVNKIPNKLISLFCLIESWYHLRARVAANIPQIENLPTNFPWKILEYATLMWQFTILSVTRNDSFGKRSIKNLRAASLMSSKKVTISISFQALGELLVTGRKILNLYKTPWRISPK